MIIGLLESAHIGNEPEVTRDFEQSHSTIFITDLKAAVDETIKLLHWS